MHNLIITADDYGYAPAYDQGILEAARAGALDAVGVMVERGPIDAASLLATGVEVGIHLELAPGSPRADAERQLDAFEASLGRPPAFLDGHHHCHAAPGVAGVVGQLAAERGLIARSVDDSHRRLLRRLGVPTPDLLVGRLREDEPALAPELEAVLKGEEPPAAGVVEWMVHPGHTDRATGSTFDAGREQDLRLLLDLLDASPLRSLRSTHAAALAA